jgi:hypothetical protein
LVESNCSDEEEGSGEDSEEDSSEEETTPTTPSNRINNRASSFSRTKTKASSTEKHNQYPAQKKKSRFSL